MHQANFSQSIAQGAQDPELTPGDEQTIQRHLRLGATCDVQRARRSGLGDVRLPHAIPGARRDRV